MLLLQFIVGIVLIEALPAGTKNFIKLPNTNLALNDNLLKAPTNECKVECTRQPECVGYSESSLGQKGCSLKTSSLNAHVDTTMTSYIQPLAKSRSYRKICGFMYDMQPLTIFAGDVGDCGIVCDNLVGCQSFVSKEKKCWMSKKGKPIGTDTLNEYCTYFVL